MDKNKLIESAAKLVAKGAYDKAIKEYSAVLKEDPKDVRVLQKMGELYQKKNDPTQAAHYFAKVAESYATDGFFLKAVALYKQVLKLDPSQLEVNLKLAELHQQLGLMTEAFGYLQGVAAHHEQKGDARASLDVLKRMMELDPENVRSREKLADMMARQDLKREAIAEYQRAAEQHRRANRTDDFLRVSERLCQLEPDNLTLNRDLAIAYLDRGDQKRALARLQVCFKASPRDPETLQLLAKAFNGLGQKAKTISVYKELAKVHADQGQAQRAEGVWAQIQALDPEDADLLARSRPAEPAAPARPQPQAQVQAQAPQAAAAPVAPQAPAAAPSLGREQLSKLLQETDVYVKYGLHDKALEHLRKVFSVDPENLDAHEKAYQIYVAAEHAPQAAEQLLNVLRLCTRQQEVRRAQPYLHTLLRNNPGHVEVPAFMAVLGNAPAGDDDVEEVVDDDDLLVVSSDDDEVVVSDPPEDALAGAYGGEEEAFTVSSGEDEPFGDEPLGDGLPMGLDDDDATSSGMRFEDPIDEGEVLVTGEFEVDEPELAAPSPRIAERVASAQRPLVPEYAAPFGQEDEDEDTAVSGQAIDDPALEFAASVGDEDELVDEVQDDWAGDEEPLGDDTLDALDDAPDPAAPAGPGFRDEAEVLFQAADVPGDEAYAVEDEALAVASYEPTTGEELVAEDVAWETPEDGQALDAGAPEEATVFGAPADLGTSALDAPLEDAAEDDPRGAEELEEAGFFLDQGLLEEARDILETLSIAYPGHRTVEALLSRLELLESGGGEPAQDADEPAMEEVAPPSVQPVLDGEQGEADAFDLAQELADDFDAAADALPTAGGDDFQYSVEEVFSEFKKGLEKVVRPEDVDTHYDLGIAYKEMGLLDDAISEFKVARDGCIGKRKELDCLTMVGMLQLMRGDAQAAVEAYREALGSEHAGGDTQVALLFELGTCFDAMGLQGKALHYFQQVAQLDGTFREVSSHVQRLEAVTSPEPDAPLPGGAPMPGTTGARSRKVGYL